MKPLLLAAVALPLSAAAREPLPLTPEEQTAVSLVRMLVPPEDRRAYDEVTREAADVVAAVRKVQVRRDARRAEADALVAEAMAAEPEGLALGTAEDVPLVEPEAVFDDPPAVEKIGPAEEERRLLQELGRLMQQKRRRGAPNRVEGLRRQVQQLREDLSGGGTDTGQHPRGPSPRAVPPGIEAPAPAGEGLHGGDEAGSARQRLRERMVDATDEEIESEAYVLERLGREADGQSKTPKRGRTHAPGGNDPLGGDFEPRNGAVHPTPQSTSDSSWYVKPGSDDFVDPERWDRGRFGGIFVPSEGHPPHGGTPPSPRRPTPFDGAVVEMLEEAAEQAELTEDISSAKFARIERRIEIAGSRSGSAIWAVEALCDTDPQNAAKRLRGILPRLEERGDERVANFVRMKLIELAGRDAGAVEDLIERMILPPE